MQLPLVSIALCSYNGKKHIKEQLDSILNQTYQNLEIIIVDDCSNDSTVKIITGCQTRDQRINFFKNEHNIGFNKNFEKAIGLCNGQFITISDQDDIWEPNKIQVLVNNINDAWLIFSNSQYTNAEGSVTEETLLTDFSLSGKNFKALLLNNFVTGHTLMFSRELLSYALPFPEAGFYDWWLGFIALYHNKLTYVDEVLTKYRVHSGATTRAAQSPEKKHSYFFDIMCLQLTDFITYPKLQIQDKKYLCSLYAALISKRERFSPSLLSMVVMDYNTLFPLLKKRKTLSKLNFAYRFARKEIKYSDT